MKKFLVVLLVLGMMLFVAACANETAAPAPTPTATPAAGEATPAPTPTPAVTPATGHDGPTRVIRVGTWNPNNFDPTFRDPITGEITMDPQRHFALQRAYEAVLEQLNVQMVWIPYVADVREVLLTSVLAGEPFADIVGLWGGSQGTILGQNILRTIDEFEYLFQDEESDWMWMAPLFGHHYFLVDQIRHAATWPMVFNISLIEQVDGLRDADGRTIFPTDLYMAGEWTWSRFEEYLEVIEAHFRGVPAPVRPEQYITPFQTDHRFTANKALHSAGVAIFGGEGLQIDTPEAIAAIEFLTRLADRGLMNVQFSNPATAYPGWTWTTNDFGRSEMVFSELPYWQVSSASTQLAERGESMGIIPFPRADFLPADGPARMESTPGNSWGILRGVDDETTRLALEVWRLFTIEFWRAFGNVDNVADFREASAEATAVLQGFDIFHPQISNDILYIFANYSPSSPNEFAGMVGVDWVNNSIMGHSIWRVEGVPEYAINVAQQLPLVHERLNIIGGALAGAEAVDNIAPSIQGRPVVMPLGTDVETFDFSEFFTVNDNVDGPLNVKDALVYIEWGHAAAGLDVDVAGMYNPGMRIRVQDSSNNLTGWHNQQVWVYDPNSTTPPEFTLQEEFPEVELDSPAADINWNQFVYSVTDADGLDLRGRMVPDLSQLDVTLPGTYEVEITVTDFAGNEATIVIEVTVA